MTMKYCQILVFLLNIYPLNQYKLLYLHEKIFRFHRRSNRSRIPDCFFYTRDCYDLVSYLA